MKKIFKIFGITILGLLGLIIIFLLVIKVWNDIAMHSERELIKNGNPGQLVNVDGDNMNVFVEGDGEHTLVFMAGWGAPCPIYAFKPLYDELTNEYRCVVIEKFGYGFSDEHEGSRDVKTLVREDREALSKAGIEGPYVLCPHSLSGLEATLWAQEYPDEIEAIIGLDMTVPGCFDPESDGGKCEKINRLDKIGGFFGANRFLMSISEFDGLTDEEIKLYIAVGCKNLGNDTVCREGAITGRAFEEQYPYPLPSVPTIQYVSGVNKDKERFVKAHKDYVEASSDGRYIQLECGHNVYNEEPEKIINDIRAFID